MRVRRGGRWTSETCLPFASLSCRQVIEVHVPADPAPFSPCSPTWDPALFTWTGPSLASAGLTLKLRGISSFAQSAFGSRGRTALHLAFWIKIKDSRWLYQSLLKVSEDLVCRALITLTCTFPRPALALLRTTSRTGYLIRGVPSTASPRTALLCTVPPGV